MTIIRRYLLKAYLSSFSGAIFLFLCIGWLSQILDKLSAFAKPGVKLPLVLYYLALRTPQWLIQIMPVSVLLASLFSLGKLSGNQEITALRASGVSWGKIFSSFIGFAFLLSLSAIMVNEKVVPWSNAKATYVYRVKINKEFIASNLQAANLVVPGKNNSQLMINFLDAQEGIIRGLVINWYSPDYRLIRTIYAQESRWENNRWVLLNGIERLFDESGIKEKKFDRQETEITESPSDFLLITKKSEEMDFFQLKDYIKKLKVLGQPAAKEEIQLYLKLSFPFINLIVIFLGLPFGILQRRSESRAVSFCISILISFIYWGMISVGQALGENRILPPLLAAWFGNLIFGLIGMAFLWKIKSR